MYFKCLNWINASFQGNEFHFNAVCVASLRQMPPTSIPSASFLNLGSDEEPRSLTETLDFWKGETFELIYISIKLRSVV